MSAYADSVARLAAARPDLAAELAPVRTLERLLGWFTARGVDLAQLDLIQQDEFCFDLLAPLGDGAWLSFAMS